MKASKDAVTLIKHFEGCHLKAYPDPGSADGRPWTIGYGHTGKEVTKGLVWTQAQADAALRADLAQFERDVEFLVKVPLTQSQFDALVVFAYNCGSDIDSDDDAEGLGDSTLLRLLNSGDYGGASQQFARWNKNDGRVMRGLVRRRAAETALFLGASGPEAVARGIAAA